MGSNGQTNQVWVLYTIQGKQRCHRASIRIPEDYHQSTWTTRRNNLRQRQVVHLEILAITHGKTWSKPQTINSIPPTDRWSNRTTKPNPGTVPEKLHQP